MPNGAVSGAVRQRVADQGGGVAVAEPVLLLEPADEFAVVGELGVGVERSIQWLMGWPYFFSMKGK